MKRLALEPGAPLEEMRVLTADGCDIGGADAVVFLAGQIWWARPFAGFAQLPGIDKLLDRGYRWIAAHRGCNHITFKLLRRTRWPGWFALIVLPLLALLAQNHVAPWQFMWLMTGAIFLGCKWLTFWDARSQIVHVRVGRALAYFFLWPGMTCAHSKLDGLKLTTWFYQLGYHALAVIFAFLVFVYGRAAI